MKWIKVEKNSEILSDSDAYNTSRPRQNGHHFADKIFEYIFWNENVWIPNKISLKFVLTIFQHWLRKWFGTDQETSHYLNNDD